MGEPAPALSPSEFCSVVYRAPGIIINTGLAIPAVVIFEAACACFHFSLERASASARSHLTSHLYTTVISFPWFAVPNQTRPIIHTCLVQDQHQALIRAGHWLPILVPNHRRRRKLVDHGVDETNPPFARPFTLLAHPRPAGDSKPNPDGRFKMRLLHDQWHRHRLLHQAPIL